MSGKCDNCDCADSTQCVKKGNSYDLVIVETENRSMDTVVVDASAAEHDGKCKCGTCCSCDNFFSTRKSGFNHGSSVISNMLKKIEPPRHLRYLFGEQERLR
ncbi:hypothetical protein FF2_022424 [Malus domestica]